MKTQNGFVMLESAKDVKEWLAKQKVTRSITRLQVHHTFSPDYTTWEKTDKKVFSEPHFGRAKSLDDYGKRTWGYSDGHGHYTAQNFTVFPDGKIIVSRNLNSKPIGIRGWNDGALCIEIYGNFDKGKDIMNASQKKAVIYLYGELCKRFNIPVNTSHIRPHCHFTAGGTYLGTYNSSRSAKTCPGTNFWGVGCSTSGFNKFLADVKAYVNGKAPVEKKPKETKVNKEGKVTSVGLVFNKNHGVELVGDPWGTGLGKDGGHQGILDSIAQAYQAEHIKTKALENMWTVESVKTNAEGEIEIDLSSMF